MHWVQPFFFFFNVRWVIVEYVISYGVERLVISSLQSGIVELALSFLFECSLHFKQF